MEHGTTQSSLLELSSFYNQLKDNRKQCLQAYITDLFPHCTPSATSSTAVVTVSKSSDPARPVAATTSSPATCTKALWRLQGAAAMSLDHICTMRHRKPYVRKRSLSALDTATPHAAVAATTPAASSSAAVDDRVRMNADIDSHSEHGDDSCVGDAEDAADVADDMFRAEPDLVKEGIEGVRRSVNDDGRAGDRADDEDDDDHTMLMLLEDALLHDCQQPSDQNDDMTLQTSEPRCDTEGYESDASEVSEDVEAVLAEGAALNDRIAAAATSQHSSNNSKHHDTTVHDTCTKAVTLHTEHVSETNTAGMLNHYELQQEEWLRQVMLMHGMTHATADVSEACTSSADTHEHEHGDDTHVITTFPGSTPSAGSRGRRACHASEAREQWQEAILLSSESLRERASARCSLGTDRHVSLMLRALSDGSQSVDYVQWSDAKKFTGRLVQLDDRGGLVCPVYFMQSTCSFTGAEIVMPSCGVSVRKVKKSDRPLMPQHIVRLQRMFIAATHSHVTADERALSFQGELPCNNTPCAACGEAAGTMCVCCLMAWHADCADATAAHLRTPVEIYGLRLSMIPKIFLSPASPALPDAASKSTSSPQIAPTSPDHIPCVKC